MIIIKEFKDEYRWLSNFWSVPIIFDGEIYPSVEHAYQAAKTTNLLEREFIRGLETPGKAKRLGKKVTLRKDWEFIKLATMLDLCRLKFYQSPYSDLLESTGNDYLQEGNTWGDEFWGVNLKSGKGENYLGRIIMLIRDELKE